MSELILNINRISDSLKSKPENIVEEYYREGYKSNTVRLVKIRIRIDGYTNDTKDRDTYQIEENLLKTIFIFQNEENTEEVELINLITSQGLLRLNLLLSRYKVSDETMAVVEFNSFMTNISDIVLLKREIIGNSFVKRFSGLKKRMFYGDREYLISIGNRSSVIMHLFTDIYISNGMFALIEIRNEKILRGFPNEINKCIEEDGALGLYFFMEVDGFGTLKKLLHENIRTHPIKTQHIYEQKKLINCDYITVNQCKGWHIGQSVYNGICGSCLEKM